MDYEVIFALIAIVLFMSLCGFILRNQWTDYCSRLFKRSQKRGRRQSKTNHA